MKSLLALLCALALALPAKAATVYTDRRPATAENYDRAASRLGFREWPAYFHNDAGAHVFVRLQAEQCALSLWLPPRAIPANQLNAQVKRLARDLGWGDADVYTGSYPWGMSVRLELTPSHGRSFGSRQLELDLRRLDAWTAQFGIWPVWIGARCEVGRIRSATPAPAVAGRFDDQDFVFFQRSTAGAPSSIRLTYGISPRWGPAALSALALWLLFPGTVLYAARRHVMRLRTVEPSDRLRVFKRWQMAVTGATFGAAMLIFMWLAFSGGRYVLNGRFPSYLMPILFFASSGFVALQGRVLGMGLEREVDPENAKQPWYRRMARETWTLVAIVAVLGLMWWVMQQRDIHVIAYSLGGLVVAVLLAGAITAVVERHTLVRSLKPLPEEVSAAFAARMDPAPPAFLGQTKIFRELKQGSVAPATLLDKLSAEQVGALLAAHARIHAAQRRDWIARGVSWGMALAGLAFLAQIVIALVRGSRPVIGPWMIVMLALPVIATPLSRRTAHRREETDLAMADTFENPRDYLRALKALEELALPANADPSLRENPIYTQRRTRLHRRLGLD